MSIYYIDNDAFPKTENELIIEENDPSLNSQKANCLDNEFKLNIDDFNKIFFSKYNIEYLGDYFCSKNLDLRVVTYPSETNTCFEKSEILGSWNPLNIIKVFYFECSMKKSLCAVVIPETGCFIDKKHLKNILNLPCNDFIKKSDYLPKNMNFGTCSPFIIDEDLQGNDGRVEKIIFDTETLFIKKDNKKILDDFSFGSDHRLSIQINYYDCFRMLKTRYPDIITDEEILTLSFKEKFVRNKGKIKIAYEFKTLNYRTAKFINSIHGYGDVSILNDYIDELDIPNILTYKNRLKKR